MSILHQTTQPSNFIVDPNRDGIANALWKAISGTLALSGATPDKFRFNTDHAQVRADLRYAIVEFSLTFPTTGVQTPTNLANDVSFGLENYSLGNLGRIEVFIDKSENTIVFRSYDDYGTVQSSTITWDTDWNNAQTIFRFGWSRAHAALDVLQAGATAFVNLADHETRVPSRPLTPFVNVVGNDNVDCEFINVKDAQTSSVMLI